MDEGAGELKKQVHIALRTISSEEKQLGLHEDISFWNSLWEKYSRKSATLKIHCWKVENEVQADLGAFMDEIGTVAFQIELTEDICEWMATQSYDVRGGLKWFSIYLLDSLGEKVLSVEHYGDEIVLYPEDDAEINEVSSFFKGDDIVNVFE